MAVSDILLTPATIWYAPVGEPLPDETAIKYGDPWGGNWISLGYTIEPVSVGYSQETFELEVQQITNPLDRVITREDVMFESVLAEFSDDNIKLAFNASSNTTPAGVGQRGFTEWKMGGKVDLDKYAFGLEGLYKDANNNEFPVRIFLHRATATLNGQLQFAKNAAAGIPIQIKALADTAKAVGEQIMLIQKVTAEATS